MYSPTIAGRVNLSIAPFFGLAPVNDRSVINSATSGRFSGLLQYWQASIVAFTRERSVLRVSRLPVRQPRSQTNLVVWT
ncbi:hypothetical protein ACE1CD_07105 [Aerosakkonema sp. BLCC-F183]|uniref:hypothetical protein n=1 Tax=Aerosakkonema sp. BLCC-F183 TaxID=3342834 RepID=UPI0035B8DFF8